MVAAGIGITPFVVAAAPSAARGRGPRRRARLRRVRLLRARRTATSSRHRCARRRLHARRAGRPPVALDVGARRAPRRRRACCRSCPTSPHATPTSRAPPASSPTSPRRSRRRDPLTTDAFSGYCGRDPLPQGAEVRRRVGGRAGSRTSNVVSPGALIAVIVPPCADTMAFAIESPRPGAAGLAGARAVAAREALEQLVARAAGSTPGPSSCTRSTASRPSRVTETVTVVPGGSVRARVREQVRGDLVQARSHRPR